MTKTAAASTPAPPEPEAKPHRSRTPGLELIAPVMDLSERLISSTVGARTAAYYIGAERLFRRTLTFQRSALASVYGVTRGRELTLLREELSALRAESAPQLPARREDRRAAIHWREGGQGPTVLLLNGWSVSGLVWPAAFVHELEKSFRVLRPDNRGTGWSQKAASPFTIRDLANDAADVLAEARAGNAIVLGLSMGGMIAQELALRHPELVKHLIIVSSSPPPPAAVRGDSQLLLKGLRKPGSEGAKQYVRRLWASYCGPGFAEKNPEVIDEIVSQVFQRPSSRSGMLTQLRATSSWHSSDRLKKIAVPTTIVHGDCDRLVPVANGMRLARLIPASEYVELEGVGHVPPAEAPDRLIDIIKRAEAASQKRSS